MATAFVGQGNDFGGGPDLDDGSRRLGQIAYEKILTGLFERRVPAGAFVSQKDLVELLGVPVQPLRDALRVLEAEGVLTIHPRSGIQFLKPDMQFVHNTYQFRSIIERAAARRYAEVAEMSVITELLEDHRTLAADLETQPFDKAILDRIVDIEHRLHGGMTAALNNPLIETTARRLKNYVTLIRLDRVMTRPLAVRTLREHIEILEACVQRDGDRAEAALAAHFQAALSRMLGMV